MRIKVECTQHPKSHVLFLEGTVKFLNIVGDYVDEASEQATMLEIDEGNLYCEGADGDHDFKLA